MNLLTPNRLLPYRTLASIGGLACLISIAAADTTATTPRPNRPAPAAADASRLENFRKVVTSDKALFGYWNFDRTLDASGDGPPFRSGHGEPVFRPGPLGSDSSVDVSNGGYISLAPCAALDGPELTVEFIFQIRYPTFGALFGIRDGGPTRFSLHYTTASPQLKLWNGKSLVEFETDTKLETGEWHHAALALSEARSILWIDGKRCTASTTAGMAAGPKGLPFLVGATDLATGKSERGEILAAHLAIHERMLDDDEIVARIKALGWEKRLEPKPQTPQAEAIARIDARIARIAKDHRVDVHYKYDHDTFIPAVWHDVGEGVQLPYKMMPAVLDEIEDFLKTVPKEISAKELDAIYLFSTLKIGAGSMGGMAYGKSIYICCMRPIIEVRYSLYHELAHILEVAYPIDKKAWESLLPNDYKYGQNSQANPLDHTDELRSKGFVLYYSTVNSHEDFAVLSDYIFVRRQQTLDLMENHPAIARKAAAVIEYYKKVGPDYDLSFYGPFIQNMDPPPPDILKKP